MANYLLIHSYVRDGYCVLQPPDIENDWEISRGISRLDGFPDDVACKMSDDFPNHVKLADSLYGATFNVISNQVREFMVQSIDDPVEFLPVSIINHKGRVASNDYFILHPTSIVDCIDTDASGVEWNDINPKLIDVCNSLVLDTEKIPESANIFRPAHWAYNILVREEFANSLLDAGFDGVEFRPTEGFTGMP